ncbi:MAG: DUF418 domain-containing protein [Rhodobacteraceae bacterium]|nr:DUF418 domain-containing protein [Paracoccaceae bacterium]
MALASRQRRNALIDSMRALALGGVVIVNMLTLSGLAYMAPDTRAEFLSAMDLALWKLLALFLESNALAAFSFLFGFSFNLMLQKLGHAAHSGISMILPRMAVLWGIGLFNAIFLFWADILMTYAALGLILPLAARLRLRIIAMTGGALIIAGPLVLMLSGAPVPGAVPTGIEDSIPAYASESYAMVLEQNIVMATTAPGHAAGLILLRFFVLSGMFLLGMAASRAGLLEQILSAPRVWAILGAALIVAGVGMQLAPATEAARHGAMLLLHLDMVVMAFGYLILISALLSRPWAIGLRRILAPLGRMSLTGYLLSAVLGQAVFYGWGLALIGQLGVAAVLAIALCVYTLLLAFAHLWFSRYLFGPWEWLWRSLSELRLQPLLRPYPSG